MTKYLSKVPNNGTISLTINARSLAKIDHCTYFQLLTGRRVEEILPNIMICSLTRSLHDKTVFKLCDTFFYFVFNCAHQNDVGRFNKIPLCFILVIHSVNVCGR